MIELRSALMVARTPANSNVSWRFLSIPAAVAKPAIFSLASAISVRLEAMVPASSASASSSRQASSTASSDGPVHTWAGEISETLRWRQGQSGSWPLAAGAERAPTTPSAATRNVSAIRPAALTRRGETRLRRPRGCIVLPAFSRTHHQPGGPPGPPRRAMMPREADQFDRVAERVPGADVIEGQARFLHAPQRIERRGSEEHREDDEIHDPGEVLELPDHGGQQKSDRAQHETGQDEGRYQRDIAIGRRPDPGAERGDDEIDEDLQDRYEHGGQQLAGQQVPARHRAHHQRAHTAHLAIVDHRERALHAIEQLDHADQAGRDVDLVEHVGLVGRDDGDAEHRAETRREDEQPHQRPHQCGEETAVLIHEAQHLPDEDAVEAAGVLDDGHGFPVPVSLVKAARMLGASAARATESESPWARTRP